MENKNAMAFDEAIEAIKQIRENDMKQISEFMEKNKLIEPILEELENNEKFKLKHAYIAASLQISYLTQLLYDDEESFKDAVLKSDKLTVERIIPSITPRIVNGEIIEEDKDIAQLSVGELMLATSSLIDNIFWKADLNMYSELKTLEEVSKNEVAE